MAREPTARPLFSSATIDCALAQGEKHHDGFDVAPREFAAVTVEPRGIEAAIEVEFVFGHLKIM